MTAPYLGEEAERRLNELVATAPPLTPEQISKLRLIIHGPGPAGGSTG
ncbi:hypothetical protein [Mycobacterium seoulense]